MQESGPLRILAEGDSWFDYPLPWPQGDGVTYRLENQLGYPINNMAHWGEELRRMLGLEQRKEIVRGLSDNAVCYDAMLFSGGGNDLVGDQFVTWLKDQGPPPAPDKMRAFIHSGGQPDRCYGRAASICFPNCAAPWTFGCPADAR